MYHSSFTSKRFITVLFFLFATCSLVFLVIPVEAISQISYDIYVLGADRSNTSTKLEGAGNNVTYEPDVYAIKLADLSKYDQVWFVDFSIVPEPTGRTNLINFMKSGGKLFFVGDSWKDYRADLFLWRDSLFNELGAGGMKQSREINPSQTAWYTNPYNITSYIPNSVHWIEHGPGRNGVFESIGNGTVILGAGLDATGDAIAIAFDYGDLEQATNSRAVVYLNSNMYENWDKYVENLAYFLGPKNKVVLTASNTKALPGNQGVIKIGLLNAVEVTGVEYKISDIPDILTPVDMKTTSRAAKFAVSYEENAGGIAAIISSESGGIILQGTGAIAELFYQVKPTVQIGDSADIVLADQIVSNKFEAELPSVTSNGKFYCEMLKGDVNMDGVINVLDLVRVINIILDRPPDPSDTELEAADMNADDTINILDVVCIINIMLGRQPGQDLELSKFSAIFKNDLLKENQLNQVPIFVDSEQPIRGVQVELSFDPEQINLADPELMNRAMNMQISSNMKNGKINIIVFSPEGAVISPGTEAILNIPIISKTAGMDKNTISIENIIAVGSDFREMTLSDVNNPGLKNEIPGDYSLTQNYPNPFNSATDISYSLPQTGTVKLTIYNLLGEEIVTIVNEKQSAGNYTAHWNGADNHGNEVPTGIYIYQLNSMDYVKTRKLTILK